MKKLIYPLLFFTSVLFSQTKKQPKVGLVLSGGGAKGFAHIGVLKELEKAGVQIDYIGGTSMGAVIGGLYASGYSANEIEKIIIESDFEKLIQDKIPRKDIPLFDKEHQERYAISLPITKKGVSLPKGASKGQNLHNYFAELFSVVDDIHSFKELPIPFFCIATDIENGEKVILEKGSLVTAIQASGALPTLLHPVKLNGRLLVDGGVADNFPVKELRKKGIDLIIGVDVQEELADRKKLGSVFNVLNQIISFQIYKKSQEQKKDVDVYLKPDIKGYNAISFSKSKAIIHNGEKEAGKYSKIFDSIAKLQTHKRKIVSKKNNLNEKFLLDQVEISGNNDYTEDYILGTLQLELCDSINYKNISKRINRLTGTKNFTAIDCKLENVPEGKRLKLYVDESENKQFLRLGVHHDQLYGLGILLNYTHKRLLTNNDVLSLDVVTGGNVRYDFNYFIDNGFYLGGGFQSSYKAFEKNVLFNDININKINLKFSELINRFYLQTKTNKKYALSVGAELRTLKADSETVIKNGKLLTYEKSNYGLAFANIKIDNFNKAIYPTRGFYLDTNFDWVLYSDRNFRNHNFRNKDEFKPFAQVSGTISAANKINKQFSFQYTFEGGLTILNQATDAFEYKIGGANKNLPKRFVNFYGWDVSDYMRNNFIKGEFELRYNFYKKHHLLADINSIKVGKNNFSKDDPFENVFFGYAAGYGLETFLGPLELRYSWAPEHKGTFLFNLGFWF